MVVEVPIFWYSKYCRECRELIDMIDPNHFVFVCVDNVDVRKRILTDTHYGIRSVPCILVFQGGTQRFHKYEGEDIFRWLEMNPTMMMMTSINGNPKQHVDHVIDIPPLPPTSLTSGNVPPSLPVVESLPLQEPPTRLAPIPEEDDGEEDVQAPPAVQTSEEVGDPSGMSDGMSSTSATTASKKPNSIMNLAQQMQRERESEDRPSPVPSN